ncbi:DUF4247 domain-containing protein [Allostreptomyces psammosilenae]|uniref:DUF4247 domain-containing protein n=1 Tax=Allostreptomyces psammosilenae TaxID=1892865 RepID=A0A852ZQ94_9ACTN|nr:DUF4247 domain-containing protein [Allostreptomyces psammosilenae]NYI04549.1 hypothetical protein [Allostreptomyces psammosilenae]
MRHTRLSAAALVAVTLLTGCSGGDADDDAPRDWIAEQYRSSDGDYLDEVDAPARVASEIENHRSARGRIDSDTDDMVFLRYEDDIVALSPYGSGSRIEIEDYATGYRRWNSHVSTWPVPGSHDDEFRGGGPGSGK